jgi:hypothetical protein
MANTPSTPQPPSTPPQVQAEKTDFRIGEEFGTAQRSLPPAKIVAICIAAVAIVLGVWAYFNRPKPQGGGSIDSVNAIEVPGQNSTMVAITFTLRNTGEHPLWVRSLKAQLKSADDKTLEDEAASSVDFERYFQAFPALKQNVQPALSPETKMAPGSEQRGTIIVSFPVTKDAFDKRKSLAITIQPYDQPVPVVIAN